MLPSLIFKYELNTKGALKRMRILFLASLFVMWTEFAPECLSLPEYGSETDIEQQVIQVGPGKAFAKPSLAAANVKDGDIIEIMSGEYYGDVAVWRQNNLTIKGANGRAHMEVNGQNAEGKAIWVIKGNNTVIENIEFSGATVSDGNGAGIRQEGAGLVLRNCYFHDNENGILTGENPSSDIVIENCEFAYNGAGDGLTHNMYIGNINSFTLKFSYSHHAKVGHNVKSRAAVNYILYNRITDEQSGNSSYAVDLPNGGVSYIIGNVIQQGINTDNFHVISYGAEGLIYEQNEIYVINNTIVNDIESGRFFRIPDGVNNVKIINNIFYGTGQLYNGPGEIISNLTIEKRSFVEFQLKDPGFVNPENYDYRLKSSSVAIDKGSDPGEVNGFNLNPVAHYIHSAKGQKRISFKIIDVGAYEFVPQP